MPKIPTQLDKFKAAAKQLECNEDEAKFDGLLKKLGRSKKDNFKNRPRTSGED